MLLFIYLFIHLFALVIHYNNPRSLGRTYKQYIQIDYVMLFYL